MSLGFIWQPSSLDREAIQEFTEFDLYEFISFGINKIKLQQWKKKTKKSKQTKTKKKKNNNNNSDFSVLSHTIPSTY